MRASRREFSIADQVAIIRRATDSSGRLHCEKCGVWVKTRRDYEFHHLVPEAMRPAADLKRKLGPADGRLWCVPCHREETPRDQANIAEAKRREAYGLGLKAPGRQHFPPQTRAKKVTRPVAVGLPGLARRGFVPARGE